jgi:acetyl-CoA synthetase
VFKSSDYRISPFELESVLIEHDAVLEAAVVPSPDPLRLSCPRRTSRCAPALHAPARNWPHRLPFRARKAGAVQAHPPPRVRELPKTISGKIRRVELRKREAAGERGTEYLDETATR